MVGELDAGEGLAVLSDQFFYTVKFSKEIKSINF